jgi:hypothetical protein
MPPSPGASDRRQSREGERRYRAREVRCETKAETGRDDEYVFHQSTPTHPRRVDGPMTPKATAGRWPGLSVADEDPVVCCRTDVTADVFAESLNESIKAYLDGRNRPS